MPRSATTIDPGVSTGHLETAPIRTDSVVRRASIGRRIFTLTVATIALVVFIILLGDVRRERVAVAQAQWFADMLHKQMGESTTLPVNVAPHAVADDARRLAALDWLTRDEIRHLRNLPGPIIVAHTQPVPRVLLSDGRAAVLHESGKLQSRWVSSSEFESMFAWQRSVLRQENNE